jgi:hypothetical protein
MAALRASALVMTVALVAGCGSILYVNVNDAKTGYPLSHVTVSLDGGSSQYTCETEHDGSVAFRVDPGTYTLTASLPGWRLSGPPKAYVMTKGDFEIAHLLLSPPPNHYVLKTTGISNPPVRKYCL